MDHIIQAIARLKEKSEELVRMTNIISNIIADTKTDILLAGERYCTNIATQICKVAKTLSVRGCSRIA